jgi:hypothetical protein
MDKSVAYVKKMPNAAVSVRLREELTKFKDRGFWSRGEYCDWIAEQLDSYVYEGVTK